MMRLVAPAGVAALVLVAAAGGAPTWSAPTRLSPADRAIGPELALAENGRAVAVWDREVGPDCASDPASLSCVHIVDAVSREPGAAWGPPVELGRPGVGSLPQVAVNSAGDAIVSWIHDIGADRVLQATIRRGPAGSWPNPNDLSVVAERIREHHVAVDAAGEAVAAWAELGGGGGGSYRVEVEVRPSGVWGAPLRLSDPGSAVLSGPSLAVNAAGAAIVAWEEDGKVRVARGSAASGSWEQPATISAPGSAPRVALDPDGNATVVWTSGADVEAASGTPAGEWEAPVEVSSTPGASPSDLDIGLDSSGSAVAVWLVGRSVYAAARGQAGRWSEARRISPALASDPELAVASSGNAVATWTLTGGGVVQSARRAAGSGEWESAVDVSAPGASAARVTIDAAQSPVVVWTRAASSAVLVEAADMAAGGPVLGPVRFPARARTGRRAVFSVEAAPWASPLAGPPVWRFGDGMSARGLRATHGPTMLDPNLKVATVVSGLTTPSSIAFLGPNDMLVLEKNTGKVLRVTSGVVQGVAIDLAVNNASERGLLGIALHPNFPANPGVYLYWTCRSSAPPTDPFFPDERRCLDANMLGADTGDLLQVPLLGNRVDRFVWNGSTLTFDRNLIMLRAFQNDGAPQPPGQGDEAQPPRGNHDGGVIAFGPDGKLYVIFGDQGRRGQLQNLAQGPTPPTADDQFGGPEPDDAHLSGVVLRLNDNGSTPTDNPFFTAGASRGGEVGANIQRIFAYGVRNSFGMAFDPISGNLWDQQNGDDTFDELNRVEAGMNGGWVQIMGPVSRIAQYKEIETTFGSRNLQQLRWPPTNIADTPAEALARLFALPGSRYSDPEFAWKWAVPPAAIGFVRGRALGSQFEGDLFAGAATPATVGGYLFRFNLTGNRRAIAVDDPRLEDRVADNNAKNDITESESLLIGRDFGVATDIETGPNGNLFVVSISNGAIYEISRAR